MSGVEGITKAQQRRPLLLGARREAGDQPG